MPTRVQLPDGNVGEFPDNMSQQQIEAVLAKQFPASNQPPGVPKAPIPAGLQGPPTPTKQYGLTESHPVNDLLSGASNFGAGVLNGIKNLPQAVIAPLKMLTAGNPGLSARDVFTQPPPGSQIPQMAQETRQFAHDVKTNPAQTLTYAAGNLAGPAALTGGMEELAPIGMRAAGEVGSSLRKAAIGNPDVPLARGLGITSRTRGGANAMASVGEHDPLAPSLEEAQGARPYAKGATSRSDAEQKLTAARTEVNAPLNKALQLVGDKKVIGPDGPTTINALEQERAMLSDRLNSLRRMSPGEQRIELGKEGSIADLQARKDAVTNAMTPHLDNTGIDSRAIRQQDAQIASTLSRIQGKTTIAEEPQHYGFGKLQDLGNFGGGTTPFDLLKPAKTLFSAGRDIVAGKPLWSGRPTDVNIQQGFSMAGPKPEFAMPRPDFQINPLEGNYPGMVKRPMLGRGPIQLGSGPDTSGPIPFTPPPVDAGTTASRLGRLLPEKTGGPFELEYYPEMTNGENAAAMRHAIRNFPSKPLMLPEKASPVIVPEKPTLMQGTPKEGFDVNSPHQPGQTFAERNNIIRRLSKNSPRRYPNDFLPPEKQ